MSLISVSIVVPVFNAQATLEKTLDSIKQQTLQNIEVLCVDDCSTDGSLQILHRYAEADARFKVCSLPVNGGVANARNQGVLRATGEYLCFLDADDWWLPQKLALQYEYMRAHDSQLTYMAYARVNEESVSYKVIEPPDSIRYKQLLRTNHIGNLTAMVSADLIRKGNLLFKSMGHEDYFFWLEALQQTDHAELVPSSQAMCFYLVRDGSLSSNKFRAAQWQWVIYRKELGLGFGKSLRYFMYYLVYAVHKRFL